MKVQTTHTLHWKAISLGVLGLIIGYSVVLAKEGKITMTQAVQCPMKNHAVISCTSGVCSPNCPGNCHHDNPPA